MKLYAPKYYKNFICIADRCRHSCCVGWEIDIDDDTAQIYASLTDGYGNEIRKSIEEVEVPHFRLTVDEKCPHLNECGLCKIILSLGENYLCEICREHPRFYHDTVRGKEVGLGMACEEACRLILTSDNYAEFVEIGELDTYEETLDFDALSHREAIFCILSDSSLDYRERLREICRRYGVTPKIRTDTEWQELLSNLEYLDDEHRVLFAGYSSNFDTPKQFEGFAERALAYLIFRHCSAAIDEDYFRVSLGFSLFCERLLVSMARNMENCTEDAFFELARILSEELEYSEENTDAIKFNFIVL